MISDRIQEIFNTKVIALLAVLAVGLICCLVYFSPFSSSSPSHAFVVPTSSSPSNNNNNNNNNIWWFDHLIFYLHLLALYYFPVWCNNDLCVIAACYYLFILIFLFRETFGVSPRVICDFFILFSLLAYRHEKLEQELQQRQQQQLRQRQLRRTARLCHSTSLRYPSMDRDEFSASPSLHLSFS